MVNKEINKNNTINNDTNEITSKDIIRLLSIKNILIKDVNYAMKHVKIEKVNIKHEYDIKIKDVDEQTHHLKVELKIYK